MAYAQAPGGVAPRKLSKTGIVWAIVVFAVTAIIGIVMIVLGVVTIADTLDDFQQIDVPGSSTLQLDGGEQWIFVGGSGVDVFEVEVSVTDPDGERVPITRDTGQSADSNGDSFQSLGRFDAERSGRYEIRTDGPPRADVRVGEIPFLRIGLLLGGGFAVGGLGFLVAAIILIVALVRRSRAKKANRLAAWGPPQAGSVAPAGYGQPGGAGYGQPGTPPPPVSPPPPAPSAPSTPPPSTPPPPASTPPPPPTPPSSPPPPPPPG